MTPEPAFQKYNARTIVRLPRCYISSMSIWRVAESDLKPFEAYPLPKIYVQIADEVLCWPDMAIDSVELETPPIRSARLTSS